MVSIAMFATMMPIAAANAQTQTQASPSTTSSSSEPKTDDTNASRAGIKGVGIPKCQYKPDPPKPKKPEKPKKPNTKKLLS